jgi:hypothetical protein
VGDAIGKLLDEEIAEANAAADRRERCLHEHGYGCTRAECGRALTGEVRGLAEFLPALTTEWRRQERIRAAILGVGVAVGIGLAIAGGTACGYLLAAMQVGIGVVMVPDRERGRSILDVLRDLRSTSDPGRSMGGTVNPQHQDEDHGG